MISRFKASSSMTFLMALRLHQMLLVLKIFPSAQNGLTQATLAHLELPGRAELVKVVLGDLGDFQQSCLSVVINDGSTLDVGLGLVGDLHDVFGLRVDHGLHDVEINDGTQVVDVGDEDVFLAGGNELVEETRVASCQLLAIQGRSAYWRASKISPCPGGYHPALSESADWGTGRRDSLSTRGYRDWLKVRMLMLWFWYFWMIRAVSSSVLKEFMRMNGTLTPYSEFKCYSSAADLSERQLTYLNLPDTEVEEGHTLPDFNDGFGTDTTHGGTETTVKLQNSKLVENRGVNRGEDLVRSNLLRLGGLDLLPVTVPVSLSVQWYVW
jgi:hypothetical protein